MQDRQTTNLLLAVIAGVLLFGSGAMLGALKWAVIGSIVIAIIAVFVYLSVGIIRAFGEAFGEASKWVYERRMYLPAAFLYALYTAIRMPFSVVLLPLYGWRKARTAGDGILSSAATATVGIMFGLLFSSLSIVAIVSIFNSAANWFSKL